MRIVIQLIENSFRQAVPSIVISIDSRKYIVNVASSFQRFVKLHRQKINREGIFLFTKLTASMLCGVTGLMLSLNENGQCMNSKLLVDKKMFNYFEDCRYKMGKRILPYSYMSWDGSCRIGINNQKLLEEIILNPKVFSGKAKIEEIVKKRLQEKKIQPGDINDCSVHYNKEDQSYQDKELKIIPFQIESQKELITNYICVPNKIKGSVRIDAVNELKIPRKEISKLIENGSMELEGKIIYAQEIMQKDQPSPNFIIMHYDSLETVQKATQHHRLTSYLANKDNHTAAVIHIAQDSTIVESQIFAKLIATFPETVEHLLFSHNHKNKNAPLDLPDLPNHFLLTADISKKYPMAMPDIAELMRQGIEERLLACKQIQKLFPKNRMHVYRTNYELIVAPIKKTGYRLIDKGLMAKKRSLVDDPIGQLSFTPSKHEWNFEAFDPKVVFLGTGSMKPNKYRNVSSILIENYGKGQSIMLDCGQGSFQQLCNHYGQKQTNKVLLSLRILFITHIHSDHNLGILVIISQRNRLLKLTAKDGKDYGKLFLIIPYNLVSWFHSYLENVENLLEGCELLFIQTITDSPLQESFSTMSKDDYFLEQKGQCPMVHEAMEPQKNMIEENNQGLDETKEAYYDPKFKQNFLQYAHQQTQIRKKFDQLLAQMGINQFYPVPVIHCPQSYGIIIKHLSQIKISYSGDTRPSKLFQLAATNSTLLIHQATFGDDLLNSAIARRHSTVGEALAIGLQSNCWVTALTHFSQRYSSAADIVNPTQYQDNPKMKAYSENNSIVCFDHLSIQLSEAKKMVKISQSISRMMPEDQ